MKSLWNAVKSLTLWQAAALALVMLGTGLGVWLLYRSQAAGATVELAEDQQIIPVQYGSIVNQVSTNGNLVFPERETLSFAVQGSVGAVLAAEGDTVSQGQELARLDEVTIALLEEAIAEERVNLLEAREALEDLLEPYSPTKLALERAAAAEKAADARFKLQQAEEELADLLAPESPTEQELAEQRERIADARFQLQQRREELADLLAPVSPTEQDIRAQEERVADARLQLEQAREDRDTLVQRDLRPDYLAQLTRARQTDADGAKDLADVREALAELEPSERELVSAVQARLSARIALDEANQALDDFREANRDELLPRQRKYAEIQASLEPARNALATLQAEYAQGVRGLLPNIRRWEQYIEPLEEELVRLRRGLLNQLTDLEAGVELARVALAEAEENLAELLNGPDALERDALEARAEAIIANLEVNERDRSELEPPEVDPAELALLESRIALAEATLSQASTDLADLRAERLAAADQLEVALLERKIELAGATMTQATADLAELEAELATPPDPLAVALHEQQVELAEATLAQAIEDLAEVAPELPDQLEIDLQRQRVASARVKLQDAIDQRQAASLYSPVNGYVAMLDVAVGDKVELNDNVMEVVDPTIIEIDGIVDEIDVLSVQVGTRAEVSLDALPSRTLEGLVTEIDEEARNEQGVVSYPIRIRVQPPEGVQPRAGLSAIASIVLREESNVLVVPQQALYGSFDQPTVKVMTDLGIAERPVSLGSSDGFWVAVVEGLAENDRVLLEGASFNSGEFSFRQLRRTTGGGPGGGGRR